MDDTSERITLSTGIMVRCENERCLQLLTEDEINRNKMRCPHCGAELARPLNKFHCFPKYTSRIGQLNGFCKGR